MKKLHFCEAEITSRIDAVCTVFSSESPSSDVCDLLNFEAKKQMTVHVTVYK